MASGQTAAVDSLLQAFLNQAIDHAILLFDTNENIIWANPAAHRIFGRPANDLIGRITAELFTPGGRGIRGARA